MWRGEYIRYAEESAGSLKSSVARFVNYSPQANGMMTGDHTDLVRCLTLVQQLIELYDIDEEFDEELEEGMVIIFYYADEEPAEGREAPDELISPSMAAAEPVPGAVP
jgi:hypothetical protein